MVGALDLGLSPWTGSASSPLLRATLLVGAGGSLLRSVRCPTLVLTVCCCRWALRSPSSVRRSLSTLVGLTGASWFPRRCGLPPPATSVVTGIDRPGLPGFPDASAAGGSFPHACVFCDRLGSGGVAVSSASLAPFPFASDALFFWLGPCFLFGSQGCSESCRGSLVSRFLFWTPRTLAFCFGF